MSALAEPLAAPSPPDARDDPLLPVQALPLPMAAVVTIHPQWSMWRPSASERLGMMAMAGAVAYSEAALVFVVLVGSLELSPPSELLRVVLGVLAGSSTAADDDCACATYANGIRSVSAAPTISV